MNDKQFEEYWKRLVTRRYSDLSAPLSKPERMFYAANILRGSVPRSGFIGYFENTPVSVIKDAHEALKIMDLDECLDILQVAHDIVLGGLPLPEDMEHIEVVPASLSEEEYELKSDEIDKALENVQESFYEYDNSIFEALCAYADKHNLSDENG